jgi:hypothetical protein
VVAVISRSFLSSLIGRGPGATRIAEAGRNDSKGAAAATRLTTAPAAAPRRRSDIGHAVSQSGAFHDGQAEMTAHQPAPQAAAKHVPPSAIHLAPIPKSRPEAKAATASAKTPVRHRNASLRYILT